MSEQETTEAPTGVAQPDSPVADPPVETQEETVTMPRQEADALRRKLAEAERERRKLEADQRKAEETRQEEAGQHRELAEQRSRELEQERGERARVEAEARVTRLATRLKFVDPVDVIGRVNGEDAADDTLALNALERIAEQSPHLVAKDPPARPEIGQVHEPAAGVVPGASADGKPQPPAGKQPVQSLDEWEALPQGERIARMAEADWLAVHEK